VIRESSVGTLLFDLLTGDEEDLDRHTGELRFDIDLLARRLIAATSWLSRDSRASHLQPGFFGSSTGGGAALVAAATVGNEVGAVVSRGGRPDMAGESLSQVTAPTLLIVGGLDTVVIRLNEEAYARLRCERELKIVPGASHLFEEKGTLEHVASLAADWFVKHLHEKTQIM
jgi:dienelactone hydrolase